MTDTPNPTPAKHVVKTSKAYSMVGGEAVNTYVTLGNKRVFVRAAEGKELSASEAKRLATPHKAKASE